MRAKGLRSFTHPDFWKYYEKLPKHIKTLADRKFELFKEDSSHLSLDFSKKGSAGTVNIGHHYRTIAFREGEDIVWFWIGSHVDYRIG